MTVLHTHALYSEDVENPKSKYVIIFKIWLINLKIYFILFCSNYTYFSSFFCSLTTLRWKHCMATKLCQTAKREGITNRDLALTQFGFFGYILIRPKEFGFGYDPHEQEAVVHFWRVLGHLVGVPDR